MDFEATGNAIRSQFNTLVATPQSLSVAWPNAKFDAPKGETWARFSIQEGNAEKVEAGLPGRWRYPGVMFVQLFAPLEKGDGDLLELADAITTAFRSTTLSGVVFRTPSIQRVGADDKWYQLNVSVPFHTDHTE